MLQLLKSSGSVTPKLTFSNPENIAPGVAVNPIDLALAQVMSPFQMTYFQVRAACETTLDYHKEEEIWIVLKGSGILSYEGTFYLLNTEDAFYFSSFKKHQIRNHSDETLLICSIYW